LGADITGGTGFLPVQARGSTPMTVAAAHAPLAIDTLRRARATARIGATIHYVESVDSTNTLAQRLAANGAPEGTVVIAETQTKGRGRLGRSWTSPPFRNLYASILLRPPIAPAAAPLLALVAGVATVEAVGDWARAALKWPNDVVIDGRKVAGILAEMDAGDERVRHVVVGIGVNLNSAPEDFPADLRDKAIGLCTAAGQSIDRVVFTDRLLSRLEDAYDCFVRAGFAALRPAWERHSSLTGCRVQIDSGSARHTGVVAGLAEDGALLLHDDQGATVRIMVGDVTVVDGYGEARRSADS